MGSPLPGARVCTSKTRGKIDTNKSAFIFTDLLLFRYLKLRFVRFISNNFWTKFSKGLYPLTNFNAILTPSPSKLQTVFMDSTLLHSKRSQHRIINEGTPSHSLIESCTSIHVYRLKLRSFKRPYLKWPSSGAATKYAYLLYVLEFKFQLSICEIQGVPG